VLEPRLSLLFSGLLTTPVSTPWKLEGLVEFILVAMEDTEQGRREESRWVTEHRAD
jgi:hypothetical protein